MIPCHYCTKNFPPTRADHRFCSDRCRSAWHRDQTLPGHITGIRARKRGGWSLTIRYPQIPDGLCIGSSVRLETTDIPRLNASTDMKTMSHET